MSGEAPRTVWNEPGLIATNSLHEVRLHAPKPDSDRKISLSFCCSLSQLSSEIEGHPLGGGMLKLEPSEAEQVLIETISFPDEKARNYQKNLQNRKGDMIFEVTTLHKRFPYAVVGGLFFLYEGAREDAVGRARISTFHRAHQVFKVFNQRINQRNEESKFEYLAIGLYHSAPARFPLFEAGEPTKKISFDEFISALLVRVAERNPEDYVYHKERIWKPSELGLTERDS